MLTISFFLAHHQVGVCTLDYFSNTWWRLTFPGRGLSFPCSFSLVSCRHRRDKTLGQTFALAATRGASDVNQGRTCSYSKQQPLHSFKLHSISTVWFDTCHTIQTLLCLCRGGFRAIRTETWGETEFYIKASFRGGNTFPTWTGWTCCLLSTEQQPEPTCHVFTVCVLGCLLCWLECGCRRATCAWVYLFSGITLEALQGIGYHLDHVTDRQQKLPFQLSRQCWPLI